MKFCTKIKIRSKNVGVNISGLQILRLKNRDKKQIWVNPDCGLKTRNWNEVKPSLENMVEATQNIRRKIMS